MHKNSHKMVLVQEENAKFEIIETDKSSLDFIQPSPLEAEEEANEEVLCNICLKPIEYYRYHCLDCYENHQTIDLCSNCWESHDKIHDLLTLKQPDSFSSEWDLTGSIKIVNSQEENKYTCLQ